MLFSHVKISCLQAKAHLVFHRCLYNKYRLRILHARMWITRADRLQEWSQGELRLNNIYKALNV